MIALSLLLDIYVKFQKYCAMYLKKAVLMHKIENMLINKFENKEMNYFTQVIPLVGNSLYY